MGRFLFFIPLTLGFSSGLALADDVLDNQLQARQGTMYVLTKMTTATEVQELPQRPVLSLTLTGRNRLGGNAGVNGYFGSFTTGSENQIYWSAPGFATTLMAGPVELMELEGKFLKTLAATQYVYLNTKTLLFVSEDESHWLEFTERTPEQAVTDLAGSRLRLTRFVLDSRNRSVPQSARVSLTFSGDAVAGTAGVNNFNGPYRLEGDGKARFGPNFATTRMAGPPEAMAFEQDFLRALGDVSRVSVTEMGIVLTNATRSVVMEFLPEL